MNMKDLIAKMTAIEESKKDKKKDLKESDSDLRKIAVSSIPPEKFKELTDKLYDGEISMDEFQDEIENASYTDYSMRRGEMGYDQLDQEDAKAWDREKGDWDDYDRLGLDDEEEIDDDLYGESVEGPIKEDEEDDYYAGFKSHDDEDSLPTKDGPFSSKAGKDEFNKAARASITKGLFNNPGDDTRWDDLKQHSHELMKKSMDRAHADSDEFVHRQHSQNMAPKTYSVQMPNSALGVPDDFFRNMVYAGGPTEMELKQQYVNKLNKQVNQREMAYGESIQHSTQVKECGCDNNIDTIPSKQQDTVSMTVNMSGSGAGGMKDLLSVLRDIDNKPATIDEPSDSTMIIGTEEEFANEPKEKYSSIKDIMKKGTDLHSKELEAPKVNGGGNPMAMKKQLESLYNFIKSK